MEDRFNATAPTSFAPFLPVDDYRNMKGKITMKNPLLILSITCLLTISTIACKDPTPDDACRAIIDACPSFANEEMNSYSEIFNVGWIRGCPTYLERYYVYDAVECFADADGCSDVERCVLEYYFC